MCIRGFAPPPPAQAFLFPPLALVASASPLPRLCLWPCRLGAGPSRRYLAVAPPPASELPGVARSGALSILPASTHADTCLRLGAGSEAMLIVKPKAFGFDGAISSGTNVSGTVVSGTVVVGTVSTVLSSPGPDDSNRAPAAKHGRAPHRRRAPGRRLLRVPEHHVLAERPA